MFEQKCLPVCFGLLLCAASVVADDDVLVDPTRPYDVAPQAGPQSGDDPEIEIPLPVLQAVFAQGQSMSALLDGQRVYAGDQLGVFRVVAIAPGEVRLEQNGEQTVLRIGLAAVKRRSLEEAK